MSKVTTTTLQDLASGKFVPMLTVQQGTLKARATVNQIGSGGVQFFISSFNASSILDGGVGVTGINFTAAMANGNYSSAGSLLSNGAGNALAGILIGTNTAGTATIVSQQNTAWYDAAWITGLVAGDLA